MLSALSPNPKMELLENFKLFSFQQSGEIRDGKETSTTSNFLRQQVLYAIFKECSYKKIFKMGKLFNALFWNSI